MFVYPVLLRCNLDDVLMGIYHSPNAAKVAAEAIAKDPDAATAKVTWQACDTHPLHVDVLMGRMGMDHFEVVEVFDIIDPAD